jgi:Sulfatase
VHSYFPKIDLQALSAIETEALKLDPTIDRESLRAVDRSNSIRLVSNPRFRPRTIVLVLNENTSFFSPSSQDSKISLIDQLVTSSGGPNGWNVYKNAVTNASCTDVSHPSLFTGTGTHESLEKLHQMPFIFDIAKARGYQTVLYTSQTLEWANESIFLSGAKIDHLLSASMTGQPIINDIGIDDIYIMNRLKDFIREKADEDLFIVFGNNAMHTPYQHASEITFPPEVNDRRLRGLFVLESAHKMLFDVLRETGRFEDALIIVTADHGDQLDLNDTSPPALEAVPEIPRVENYEEEILRIPFLIKEPAGLPEEMSAGLRANQGALVSNLDIAPTLADMLGVGLNKDLEYAGNSLFKKIPDSRISVSTSTNEWRSWARTAIALARKQDRFTCNNEQLCVFHNASRVVDDAMTPSDREVKRLFYMNEALKFPIVAQNISRIYHDRLGIDWSPPSTWVVKRTSLRSSLEDGPLSRTSDDAILRASAGHPSGHIIYGPYWKLPKGSYRGEITLELGPGGKKDETLCREDIFDGETVLAERDVTGGPENRTRQVEVPFTVANKSEKKYEIRLWCSGDAPVTVKRVAFLH